MAGLDARQILADAVGERNLTGARDIAAVIDTRIRRRVGTLVPLPPPRWSAQPTGIADPERRAYAEQIAGLMGRAQSKLETFIGLLRRARRSRPAGQQQEAAVVCALPPAAPDGEQQTESAVLSRESASLLTT